jgi:hypothetical protein
MLYGIEPEEYNILTPGYKTPLPEWGGAILEYIGPRIMLEADQIIPNFFSSGNRTGRKKLFQLSQAGYLKRHELSTSREHFIAYTLGKEGMRHTHYMAPEVDIFKAQELIVANQFCIDNEIEEFRFQVSRGLLIGKVMYREHEFSLWCPRKQETRFKSLRTELPLSSHGLIIVAPDLKIICHIAENLKNLYVPVYFAVDKMLDTFWTIEDNVLVPVD